MEYTNPGDLACKLLALPAYTPWGVGPDQSCSYPVAEQHATPKLISVPLVNRVIVYYHQLTQYHAVQRGIKDRACAIKHAREKEEAKSLYIGNFQLPFDACCLELKPG